LDIPPQAVLLALAGLFVLMGGVTAWALFYRIRNHRKARHLSALEALWHPWILDILEGEGATPDLQSQVAPSDRLHFLVVLDRFARRLRGEEEERLQVLAQPFLPTLDRLLEHRKEEERAWGLRLLGHLGGETARPRVRDALADPSPLVTITAMAELADPANTGDVPRILEALPRLEGWNRYFLASVLTRFGGEAAPDFRRALMDPGRPIWLRVVAAETLLGLNDIPSGDDVARLLREEEDLHLLIASLNLLARVGRETHLPQIRARLKSPDFPVRAAACTALGGCGGPEELPALLRAMEDPEPWVALHAARAVRSLGGSHALDGMARGEGEMAVLAGQVLREVG
jgi:HEAT repeat protein